MVLGIHYFIMNLKLMKNNMINNELNYYQKFVMMVWGVFRRDKIKMYEYSLKQGFPQKSSYYTTKYAKKDLVKFIVNHIYDSRRIF
jgi:hypothetical protein